MSTTTCSNYSCVKFFLENKILGLKLVERGYNGRDAVRFNDVSIMGIKRQMALVSVYGTTLKIS